MRVDLFRERYPNSMALKCIESYQIHSGRSGQRILDCGLLAFTPDTAHCWAGPYEDGCAVWVLNDWSQHRDRVTGRTLQEEWDELQDKALRYESVHGKPTKADMNSWRVPLWYMTWLRWSSGTSGYAEPSKPFGLYVSGNDDTSYTKFYASECEACEELSLMLACEPLDFHRDFMSLGGWVFTN